MILGKDLRLGNYVYDRGHKVIRIDFIEYIQDGFDTKFGQNMFVQDTEVHPLTEFSDFAEPIPLTIKWLSDFGFKSKLYGDNCYLFHFDFNELTHDYLFSLKWIFNSETKEFEGFPFFNNGTFKIEFVHELQNLFFALTRKELKLAR